MSTYGEKTERKIKKSTEQNKNENHKGYSQNVKLEVEIKKDSFYDPVSDNIKEISGAMASSVLR